MEVSFINFSDRSQHRDWTIAIGNLHLHVNMDHETPALPSITMTTMNAQLADALQKVVIYGVILSEKMAVNYVFTPVSDPFPSGFRFSWYMLQEGMRAKIEYMCDNAWIYALSFTFNFGGEVKTFTKHLFAEE